ncbi:MAG TPA: type VI secretion system tube protein Hcp [Roseateles sp.]|nr:type VI secretion system tube protein Hcp [Roseateles sp.]
MAVNAFIKFDGADGESVQKGKEKWIEIQGWDWEIEAETSWTKGGGASVGKPNPGKMNFEHYFDFASPTIMKFICTGKAFPKVELQMMKTTGSAKPETYFTMTMEGVFITKVSQNGTEEGSVQQKVEMVFKTVKIDYRMQDNLNGQLKETKSFKWDIPAGTAE